jgi:hypothetical protein
MTCSRHRSGRRLRAAQSFWPEPVASLGRPHYAIVGFWELFSRAAIYCAAILPGGVIAPGRTGLGKVCSAGADGATHLSFWKGYGMDSHTGISNGSVEQRAGKDAMTMASDDPRAVHASHVVAQEADLYAVAELGYD